MLRLSLQARDGDVGGPVLDAAGRVTGLLLPRPGGDQQALPGDVAFALKAGAMQTGLTAAGASAAVAEDGGLLAPEDLTVRATGMTVLVSCWE